MNGYKYEFLSLHIWIEFKRLARMNLFLRMSYSIHNSITGNQDVIRIMPFIDKELLSKGCRSCKESCRALNSSSIKLLRIWLDRSSLINTTIHQRFSIRSKVKYPRLIIFKQPMIKIFLGSNSSNSRLYMNNATFRKKSGFISCGSCQCVAMNIRNGDFLILLFQFRENTTKLINHLRVFFVEYSCYVQIDIHNHTKFIEYSLR